MTENGSYVHPGQKPVLGIERLEQAYLARDPGYAKGITVPALVDVPPGGGGDHRDVNPTGIVPRGPALAGWLAPHGREALGGRPFGDGSPPGPPPAGEAVPAAHTPLPR